MGSVLIQIRRRFAALPFSAERYAGTLADGAVSRLPERTGAPQNGAPGECGAARRLAPPVGEGEPGSHEQDHQQEG